VRLIETHHKRYGSTHEKIVNALPKTGNLNRVTFESKPKPVVNMRIVCSAGSSLANILAKKMMALRRFERVNKYEFIRYFSKGILL